MTVRSVLVALLVSGCGASEEAVTTAPGALVGALAGTDARVGLVVNEERGVLYVCGGEATRASLTRWFSGARTAKGLDWTTDDLRVVASPSGAGWSGEVRRADGSALSFSLSPAAAGTIAGLYEAKLPEGRAGVVVFQATSAEPATILGAFKSTGGVFEQVLPVREVARAANGIEVRIAARTFFVQPVAP